MLMSAASAVSDLRFFMLPPRVPGEAQLIAGGLLELLHVADWLSVRVLTERRSLAEREGARRDTTPMVAPPMAPDP